MNKTILICQLLSLLHLTTLQLHPMLRSRFLSQRYTPPQVLITLPQQLFEDIQLINNDSAQKLKVPPAVIRPTICNYPPKSIAHYFPPKAEISFADCYLDYIPTLQYFMYRCAFRHHYISSLLKSKQKDVSFLEVVEWTRNQDHKKDMCRPIKYYSRYDAELFAVRTAHCSTCVTLAWLFCSRNRQHINGFIGKDQIAQELLRWHNSEKCQAHDLTTDSARELDDALRNITIKNQNKIALQPIRNLNEIKQQISKLDYECGPIIERHKFDDIKI